MGPEISENIVILITSNNQNLSTAVSCALTLDHVQEICQSAGINIESVNYSEEKGIIVHPDCLDQIKKLFEKYHLLTFGGIGQFRCQCVGLFRKLPQKTGQYSTIDPFDKTN